jgi:hypothetical protein
MNPRDTRAPNRKQHQVFEPTLPLLPLPPTQNVAQLILLDPVCVLLALPDVAYNFLYRRPRTLMETILYYGGSTEITIHHTLRCAFGSLRGDKPTGQARPGWGVATLPPFVATHAQWMANELMW